MQISLIVAYRNRPQHLACLLEWFAVTHSLNGNIELIIVESSATPSLRNNQGSKIRYEFLQGSGNFNKSRLLNIGLEKSRGEIIVPYDVDLVPVDLSFRIHAQLAQKHVDLLVTGYRLNYDQSYLDYKDIEEAKLVSAIAVEDSSPTFIYKQLVGGQRFGVLPFFWKNRLIQVGGWDERFEGWGGEDQDALERYLGTSTYLFRSPDLIYIHLKHTDAVGWNDPRLTLSNQALYHSKKKERLGMELNNGEKEGITLLH